MERVPVRFLPGVGPATEGDLERLGIAYLDQLVGEDGDALYLRLGRLDGRLADPCVADVFASLVAIAAGEPARPWFSFSEERKARWWAEGRPTLAD